MNETSKKNYSFIIFNYFHNHMFNPKRVLFSVPYGLGNVHITARLTFIITAIIIYFFSISVFFFFFYLLYAATSGL